MGADGSEPATRRRRPLASLGRDDAQEKLGVKRGSIKGTVLIETILAAFEMDEILYELREHSAGLNIGRWDYIFSCIKKFKKKVCTFCKGKGENVVIDYNMDIGDYMEYSGSGFYLVDPSNEAFKFMINYLVYGMTR